MDPDALTVPAETEFTRGERARREARIGFWNRRAMDRDRWRRRGRVYHDEIIRLLRFLIPKGARILEIGSTTGDLLAALEPSRGVGVDFAPEMVKVARQKYPGLQFIEGDAEQLPAGLAEEEFDFIVMSDLVGHLGDVWKAFREARRIAGDRTRLIVTWYNFLWEPLLKLGEKVGWKMPVDDENWLSLRDLEGLLSLNHFETVVDGSRTLVPARIPLFAPACNKLLSPLPGLRQLNLIQYLVARPMPLPEPQPLSTSVVIPCRNERGNVLPALQRLPPMGPRTEVIFCDGHSSDGTIEAIEAQQARAPEWPFEIRLVHQDGTGKGDAVRKAFLEARNDVLFILDADLTVAPEDLTKFYLAMAEGRGELINGTRMVYPMEKEAMRTLNILGNKFFSLAFSWILGQRIKDTLCGTKVIRRQDYLAVRELGNLFGDTDRWGDFELILGAAKKNLKIADLPVRYRARTYGVTKMNSFRTGWKLLRMAWQGFLKLRLQR